MATQRGASVKLFLDQGHELDDKVGHRKDYGEGSDDVCLVEGVDRVVILQGGSARARWRCPLSRLHCKSAQRPAKRLLLAGVE